MERTLDAQVVGRSPAATVLEFPTPRRATGFDARAAEVLDALDDSVYIVAADGSILGANRAARGQREGGRDHDPVVAEVRLVVDSCLRDALLGREPAPHRFVRQGKRYEASVRPFGGSGTPACALVVVRELAGPTPPSVRELVRECGLTPKEAEVARRLALGRRPESIAGDLGLAVETVRGHLKNVYHKMRVHRQAAAPCTPARAFPSG
jgi:DNA-binding CsgD family transcriptional regulator